MLRVLCVVGLLASFAGVAVTQEPKRDPKMTKDAKDPKGKAKDAKAKPKEAAPKEVVPKDGPGDDKDMKAKEAKPKKPLPPEPAGLTELKGKYQSYDAKASTVTFAIGGTERDIAVDADTILVTLAGTPNSRGVKGITSFKEGRDFVIKLKKVGGKEVAWSLVPAKK